MKHWRHIVVLACALLAGCAAGQHGATYLGCFDFGRLLYMKGMEGVKGTQYSRRSIGSCFDSCQQQGYSLTIYATDYRCWCAASTPDVGARVDESACDFGSRKGGLVFYNYDGGNVCRLEQLPVGPDNFIVQPNNNKASVMFDPLSQTMAMQLQGTGAARATAKFTPQLYGQFEVMARVSTAGDLITSIDVRDAEAPLQAKALAPEEISWQFYNLTATGAGKNMLLTAINRGTPQSSVENLVKPGQYKAAVGLKNEENIGNTWVTYTIDWQPDRVTWAMNGVPVCVRRPHGSSARVESAPKLRLKPASQFLTNVQNQPGQQTRQHGRSAGLQQHINQQQQQQQQQSWVPPSKPARFSFSIKSSPQAAAGSSASPAAHPAGRDAQQSGFMDVRRIVCDRPRVRGHAGPQPPVWFILGPDWSQQINSVGNNKLGKSSDAAVPVTVQGNGQKELIREPKRNRPRAQHQARNNDNNNDYLAIQSHYVAAAMDNSNSAPGLNSRARGRKTAANAHDRPYAAAPVLISGGSQGQSRPQGQAQWGQPEGHFDVEVSDDSKPEDRSFLRKLRPSLLLFFGAY